MYQVKNNHNAFLTETYQDALALITKENKENKAEIVRLSDGWTRYSSDDSLCLRNWNAISNYDELAEAPYWAKKQRTTNKPAVFFDLDGTLAKWYPDGRGYDLDGILDPKNHYFLSVEPIEKMCELAILLAKKDIDVCILSSAAQATIRDKIQWVYYNLGMHIPEENMFFCPLGANKANFTNRDNVKDCILVDDFNVNLRNWKRCGGISIKAINGINSSSEEFEEINLSKQTVAEAASFIENILKKKQKN